MKYFLHQLIGENESWEEMQLINGDSWKDYFLKVNPPFLREIYFTENEAKASYFYTQC